MKTIDEIIKTKFKDDRHRFIANMMYTSNWLQNSFVDFLKPYALSPQQFNILRILRGAKEKWVTMNDIKELMIEKAPNATRLSDKLLDKGLVDRKRADHDRRVVYLSITPAGLDLLAEIDKEESHLDKSNFDNITEEEAKICSHIIDKLRNSE
ncbi:MULTISPECIES: MarR family winged helix-turn-helix transcriptional regulator [Flammeovirga]|uniref:MarR family transcriptional regulator n=1 Tax=Flammeovirga agarivorans TaxID=2726742 RepID=A0A7X8SGR2_9BACT|nr:MULTISPECIES: MarR family transcriptional regulator [Flammeovirga]NLR89827.1 MarR family transcriptional regulator [Flammeovirga agarivorans]